MPACASRRQARALASRSCGALGAWGFRGVIVVRPSRDRQPWGAGIAVVIALVHCRVLVIECRPGRSNRRRALLDFLRQALREGHQSFAVRNTEELELEMSGRGFIAP